MLDFARQVKKINLTVSMCDHGNCPYDRFWAFVTEVFARG